MFPTGRDKNEQNEAAVGCRKPNKLTAMTLVVHIAHLVEHMLQRHGVFGSTPNMDAQKRFQGSTFKIKGSKVPFNQGRTAQESKAVVATRNVLKQVVVSSLSIELLRLPAWAE